MHAMDFVDSLKHDLPDREAKTDDQLFIEREEIETLTNIRQQSLYIGD